MACLLLGRKVTCDTIWEASKATMPVSSATIFRTDGTSPDLGYLSESMFIGAARALGLGPNEEVPPEAQETIIQAATMLVEGLREILKMTTSCGEEPEVGN